MSKPVDGLAIAGQYKLSGEPDKTYEVASSGSYVLVTRHYVVMDRKPGRSGAYVPRTVTTPNKYGEWTRLGNEITFKPSGESYTDVATLTAEGLQFEWDFYIKQ